MLERDRFDGGSLMLWGGTMGGQKTDLVVMQDNLNACRYRRRLASSFLYRQSHGVTFKHDNATPP